ncbi:MAG: A/G-specific adenine glycosylase [Bdellovibrionaceae bacterium]|nr:A/G-specific adenine glycosylase [Pseudobdellovibrionaceae bacterium]
MEKRIKNKATSSFSHLAKKLVSWYAKGHRDLPWRHTKDPYAIWISEIMLQQTTSQAVIPFYERFLKRFPHLKKLSQASQEDVYELWAGLGYYSRARNILKAAKELVKTSFPQSWEELIQYPGFGPYTARAVTSFAFNEPVGVVDGNVVRVLSRLFDVSCDWWTTKGRNVLQNFADQLVQSTQDSHANQALMELGATICTPKTPTCALCPWSADCLALQNKTITQRPRPKPRPTPTLLLWKPEVVIAKNKIAMVENNYAPFLRKDKIFPGKITELQKPPKQFDFKHTITRFHIYTQLAPIKKSTKSVETWVDLTEFSKVFPYSLYKKTIEHHQEKSARTSQVSH